MHTKLKKHSYRKEKIKTSKFIKVIIELNFTPNPKTWKLEPSIIIWKA